jgi:hypothetical protein
VGVCRSTALADASIAGRCAITAVLALMGKKEVTQAAPPAPEQTIDSVKADVAEIKESAQR